MISLMLQSSVVQIFSSTAVVKFSPLPSFARDAVLMPLFSLIQSCSEAVKGISTLMLGFVPVYAGILTVGGQGITASGMSFLLLAAAGAVSNFSSFVIVPLMSCYLGVGLAGSVMPTGGTNRLGESIKKAALHS